MKLRIHHLLCTILFCNIALLSACSGPVPAKETATTSAEAYWPTQEWRKSEPEAQGMDSEKLNQMLSKIEEQKINLHGLLLIRHGYIVSERYYAQYKATTTHELYSVTKSFTSTLIGIAKEKNYLELGQSVFYFFPDKMFDNMDARKETMTVENLLMMASGLKWEEADATYQAMYRSADWVKYVLDKPMAEQPGAHFNYNSGVSHILSAIIQEATGMSTIEFASQYLFEPLGIHKPLWNTDSQNIAIGGWGLQLTPRDMAKLGYLFLRQGAWDGKQIVSPEWVKTATKKQISVNDESNGYGYQWWMDGDKAYSAAGRYGQLIYVYPELDLVIVFTAQIENTAVLYDLIHQFIVPACTN